LKGIFRFFLSSHSYDEPSTQFFLIFIFFLLSRGIVVNRNSTKHRISHIHNLHSIKNLKCEETSWSSMPPYSLLWDAFQNVDYTWFAIFVYSLKFVVMASSSKDQLLNFVHLIKKNFLTYDWKHSYCCKSTWNLAFFAQLFNSPNFLNFF
jgi:hypothetical protein